MKNIFQILCVCYVFVLVKPVYADISQHDSSTFNTQQLEKVGKSIVDDLLSHQEFMLYISDHFTGIHYAEAALGFAAMDFSNSIDDQQRLAALQQRFNQVPDVDKLVLAKHVDANVYGIVPLQDYLITGNQKSLKQGLELADAQWLSPLENGMSKQTRYWIDDIYMVNILQVQAYKATKNKLYLQRAALQTANYLIKLQQRNGLFFHGENAPFFWGRGNGWVAAGLAVLLAELPASNPHYSKIVAGYQRMMSALLSLQAEDGMWRQLVNEPKSWKETSATAMFGYAILEGVKRGLLTDPSYTQAYEKAWIALNHYINDKGQLSDVCVGTGQSLDINYYLQRPKITGDYHGQAPLLWFTNGLLTLK